MDRAVLYDVLSVYAYTMDFILWACPFRSQHSDTPFWAVFRIGAFVSCLQLPRNTKCDCPIRLLY